MAKLATLTATDLGDDLRVIAFVGTEALCRPFRFDIHFMVGGGGSIDLAAGIGSRAKLVLQREEHQPFTFHGILSSVRLLVQTAQWTLYQATLVPALWRLGITQHSNAFTKITVPDLIKKVLEDSGLTSDDFELKLDGKYKPEELIVQYKESNLAFLHRWLEHEGLYYFFDHSGDKEKLIIVDHRSLHDKMVDKKVRYLPISGDDTSSGECFDTFHAIHNATVQKVCLSDYDYARPALDVSAESDVSERGVGELSIYGARFFDPEDAKRFAKLRAEELKSREVTYHAAGTALHASPGYLFELEEHPADVFNRGYLITEVHHFGNQLAQAGDTGGLSRWLKPEFDELYHVEASAVADDLQYRAPLTTPWPRVWGFENGVVDGGAESPYAQIDDMGRYLVKFHFDESDLDEGKASTFVRMMQPHGGTSEGFHFPLRKGTEVIFTFLGGDPDRPVIAGVVPNATTPSVITEANRTKNMIRTGSGNHITIDDKQGVEFIHLFTPKLTEVFMGGPTGATAGDETASLDFNVPPTEKGGGIGTQEVSTCFYLFTDGAAGFWVEGEWWQSVCNNMFVSVDGNFTEHYTGTHILNNDGDSTQYYNAHLEVEVASGERRKVTGLWDLEATDKAKILTPEYQLDATTKLDATTPQGTLNFNSQATLNFGTTSLNFGGTTIHWGATTGDLASLNISIPGGATINTPTWDVVNPTNFWNSAFHQITWGEKISIAAQDITGAVFKSENAAIEISFVGLKDGREGTAMWTKAAEVKTIVVNNYTQSINVQVSTTYIFA